MMFPKSIRWQLPFSYALLALLSTLALGVVLLLMLRSYYTEREITYLNNNADTISQAVQRLFHEDAPLAAIQAQITSYAFLSQVRIQLVDATGAMLADTGVQHGHNLVSISALPPEGASAEQSGISAGNAALYEHEAFRSNYTFRANLEVPISIPIFSQNGESGTADYYTPLIRLDFVRSDGNADDAVTDLEQAQTSRRPSIEEAAESPEFTLVLPASGTLYGFGLGEELSSPDARSGHVAQRLIVNDSGQPMGQLLMSEGPAYGGQIVAQVGRVWVFAGGLAVALAALVGWGVSRRITEPLIMLTSVTSRMATGVLSVRSTLQRNDELGMLASAFNDMARRVEETVVTLRRFVADAAHELHTPITALHTNLELATDDLPPSSARDYVERARAQLKRLENLTDSLLDLSRIEARVAEDTDKPVALSGIVMEVSELYASRSEQLGINFVLEISEAPVFVRGSAWQLRSVLTNLLDNAIKFTPPGETISLRVRSEGEWVEVQVQDRGIGVPAEELPLIFSRFHRCRNAAAYPGSGLGLAIVKSVIDAHHGQIAVRNTAPGTSFTVMLPASA
jgi:signal transduction histidine kinase